MSTAPLLATVDAVVPPGIVASIDAIFAAWPVPAGCSFRLTIQSISVTVAGKRVDAGLRISTHDTAPACPVCSTVIPGWRGGKRERATDFAFRCACGITFFARKMDRGWKTAAIHGEKDRRLAR